MTVAVADAKKLNHGGTEDAEKRRLKRAIGTPASKLDAPKLVELWCQADNRGIESVKRLAEARLKKIYRGQNGFQHFPGGVHLRFDADGITIIRRRQQPRHDVEAWLKTLSAEQKAGRACIDCGRKTRAMIPAEIVFPDNYFGGQVFRCDPCATAAANH